MKSELSILIILTFLLFVNISADTHPSRNNSVIDSIDSIIAENVYFTNENEGARLAGTLTIPDSEGKFPAVVLISGSGLQDRDETAYGHSPFKVLAEYLSRRYIAVLRYDDRGAGESKGNLNNITPENFAEDAYAGIKYLKSRNEILNDKIGIIGHSMGAVEGSILASRYDDVSFLIMLGGPGLPLDENMLKSDSLNNTRSGQSKEVVNSGQNLLKMMIAEVNNNLDIKTTEKNLKNIIDNWRSSLPEKQKRALDSFTKNKPDHWDKMASEWSTPYFRYVLNYDPHPVLKEISCPVLSLIGEKDVQTMPIENSKRIKTALKNGKCNNYRVEILENLNHLFQTCETGIISEYAIINESFNVEAMELIINWIRELSS